MGQFVDLEKLIPQDKFKRPSHLDESTRLGWWQKGGDTFLAPVEKHRKITNVNKWDQAFRVYTTIYCQANPQRAGEILQYVDDIHTAAGCYIWDNVAYYDYTFRHLLEYNPQRSWALTYNQMWNLTMVEPLVKKGNYVGNGGFSNKSTEQGNRPKYDHCWSFNRGYCKYGSNCRYDDCCSYCDSLKHGRNTCPKYNGRKSSGGNSNANDSGNSNGRSNTNNNNHHTKSKKSDK